MDLVLLSHYQSITRNLVFWFVFTVHTHAPLDYVFMRSSYNFLSWRDRCPFKYHLCTSPPRSMEPSATDQMKMRAACYRKRIKSLSSPWIIHFSNYTLGVRVLVCLFVLGQCTCFFFSFSFFLWFLYTYEFHTN
jgi:hypothetical protein